MKRIAFVLLAMSFALINFAAAQDDERPAPVDRHNVARRQAAPQPVRSMQPQLQQRSMQPQAQQRLTSPRFQQPSFRTQQPQQPRFSPRVDTGAANRPRFDGPRFNGNGRRGGADRPIIPTVGVNPDTNVTVPTPVPTTATPDWRNRGGRAGDWRNRNNDNGAAGPTADTAEFRRGGHRGWHDRHEGDPNFRQEHQRYHERHDRSWWRNRYNRFALFGGGYYYWNSGFWYPAYGYDSSYTTYTYDAPIYGYNDQDPTQVMADVQAELARRGYYYGAIDGTYGPQTRAALLRYQRENGLAVTGRIDQPTLESLGYQ